MRRRSLKPSGDEMAFKLGYYDRLKAIIEKDKNKKENMSVHFLKSMMTPEDINTWFHDGNPVVKQYLTPRALSSLRLDNSVRKMCVDLMLKIWFDRVILISICLNAIFLAADNPLNTKNQKVFKVAELVFNIVFTLEFAVKIIAQGAFDRISGYFQDPWNRFDFSLLWAGWLPFLFELGGLSGVANFSFVRAVRILKVLKTVKSVPDLKRLVQAVIDALPRLLSVGYVLAFIFLLFGILGTQLFAGFMRYRCFPAGLDSTTYGSYSPDLELCSPSSMPGTTTCPNETPVCSMYYPGTEHANRNTNAYRNFDNTLTGFLTILVIITLEGWSEIMYDMVETSGLAVVVYFITLVVLGSFFVINLVIAVIYQSYINTIDELKQKDVQNKAKLKQIYRCHRLNSISFVSTSGNHKMQAEGLGDEEHKPPLVDTLITYSWFPVSIAHFLANNNMFLAVEQYCRHMVDSNTFHISLVFVILFNIVVLAVEANGVEGETALFVFVANALCTAIFFVELCLQIIALNIPTFFSSNFNILDTGIVVISLAELFYGSSSTSLSAFRTLRVLRTFKLLKRWDSLQQLILAVFKSGPGLGYFCVILFLYMFVCSLMGLSLFAGNLNSSNEVRVNFDTLFLSFVTTFQLVTGENWDTILYHTMSYSPVLGALFCMFVYVSGNLVVLNILLAILLENFSEKKGGSESYYDRLEQHNESFINIILGAFVEFKIYIETKFHGRAEGAKKNSTRNQEGVEINGDSPARSISASYSGKRMIGRMSSSIFIRDTQSSGVWDGWNGGNGNNPNSNAKGRMFIENIDNYCQTTMKLLPIGNYIRETKTTMKEVFLGCLMSCELVDLLLDLNIARNLDEAIRIGQELVYRRKILPLQITLDGTPDESMRSSRRHAAVNKSVSVSMVQFKDDNSLFRTNFQEAQVTEWLLESRSSEDRIQQLVKHEKDREIADILTGNSLWIVHAQQLVSCEVRIHRVPLGVRDIRFAYDIC